jgi:hypothetical protein
MMIVGGVYHAIVGIAALFNDKAYVGTPPYIHEFDLTSWAWALLLLGILVAEGVPVLQGQAWGRATGIGVAVLNLIANFLGSRHLRPRGLSRARAQNTPGPAPGVPAR